MKLDPRWLDGAGRNIIGHLLACPVTRRELTASVIVATQAREGITTTIEQARTAYDKVHEGLCQKHSH